MDHQNGHDADDGPWAGGWMIAAVAGLAAAALARLIGEADIFAAFLIGQLVFMIFGVLLGSGGVELTAPDHGDDTTTGHH